MMYSITFLFLIINCVSSELPSNFPRCNLNDPELNKCILNATEELKPQIGKGIKNVKIPALDPLLTSAFYVKQESELLNYTFTASNCIIRGLDNYKFHEIRYDPKTMTFNGSVEFDSVILNCTYEMQGKILTIPVEGKGNFEVALINPNTTFEVDGKIKNRKGVDYYNPMGTKIRGTIDDMRMQLNGLFDGNEDLGRITNNMLNKNSKQITQAATPAVEKLAEQGLIRMMKLFTRAVPYNELFSQ